MKAQPAGVITISGITFFRTISLPYPKAVCKMGKSTNNFRFFGIKRRFRNFSPLLVDTSDRMCYDDSVGASLRRCPLSVSLRLLSNLVGGISDTRPTGIKKELLPQRDPTYHLDFSHAPITVWPRALPQKQNAGQLPAVQPHVPSELLNRTDYSLPAVAPRKTPDNHRQPDPTFHLNFSHAPIAV